MTDELKKLEQELEAQALRINAGRKPKFGDLMRNPWAGESNPRRDAYFVRRVGDHYEFTDKRGDFWQTRSKFAFFIDATQPAPIPVQAGREATSKYTPEDGERCANEHRELCASVEADMERIRREAGGKPPAGAA
jgi:hypothetical protein